MRRANVVFLLHMHQPEYVDPTSGRALLPWVRLHGARGYLDVGRLLEEHPEMRLTVNFVPSLVRQLEAVAAGASDEWLRVAEQGGWGPEERDFLVARYFSLNWDRSVRPRPRYAELLARREHREPFSDADLRDLAVLFNLAWIGFAARQGDGELAALEHKGRGYDRGDLALVVAKQRAACAAVLPLYRRLAERGQVELSSSPFYHPILPLVIDSDSAARAMPEATLPAPFRHPDDAEAQIGRAQAAHTRVFGRPPAGMWPPEGSISPEALAAYGRAGIGWLATDEGNLWRSLARTGEMHGRGDLYRPWRAGGVDLVFRDRELSDKIGFAYAHGDSEAGAADLLGRAQGCAALSTAPVDEPALVPIFLDGENPWESYPGCGEPFLRALFSGLAHHPTLRSASIGQHLAEAPSRRPLSTPHSGSWIDSDFHIWIADPVKNRAWELLGRARARYDRAVAVGASAEAQSAAYEHLLAAEGSDWFWWFGEPFHSQEDALFDRLFRAHLSGAYQALGIAPPPELAEPVASARGESGATLTAPYALIQPTLGGQGFYDWDGAGRYRVPRGAAMADRPLVVQLWFGFDRETLFFRLEPAPGRERELAAARLDLEVGVQARRLRARSSDGQIGVEELDGAEWRGRGAGRVERRRGIELALPFALFAVRPHDRLLVSIRLIERESDVALARYPGDGTLAIIVPGDDFEATNWSA